MEVLTNYRAKVDKLSSGMISQNPHENGNFLKVHYFSHWFVLRLGPCQGMSNPWNTVGKFKALTERKGISREKRDIWMGRNKGLEEKRSWQRHAGAPRAPLESGSMQQKPCCSGSSHYISFWISAAVLERARPIVPISQVTTVRHWEVKQPAQDHINSKGCLRDVSPHPLVLSWSFLCKEKAGLHCNMQITRTPLSLKLFGN